MNCWIKYLLSYNRADNTCSDMVLDSEEVRVLVDDFDDVNHELVEIKKIIEGFEKEAGIK